MSDKEERIELTKERLEALEAEIERTGAGAWALMRQVKDNPLKLTHGIIQGWRIGQNKTTKRSCYEYVMAQYALLPDKVSGVINPVRKDQIVITPEMREHLNAEFERSGLTVSRVLRYYPTDQKKLGNATLSHWRSGHAQFANAVQWETVLDILSRFPEK